MDFRTLMTQRRAVNYFDTDKPVPNALIKEMIEIAAIAPSSFNLQPWNLIIAHKAEEKMRLRKLAMNQPKVSEAPVVMIVLADKNGWQKGHPTLEKNFREMVKTGSMTQEQYQWFVDACAQLYGANEERKQAFACKNTGFFAMSLMLAAKSLGLDSHPMDGFDHDAVRTAFKIPENFWIPLLLAVGYFRQTETLSEPKWRKTFNEIVVKFD